MNKMLPTEFKEQWLTALRSGKYRQGMECLRWGDEFCCLGVACDMVNPKTWEHGPDDRDWATASGAIYLPCKGDLPSEVLGALENTNVSHDGFCTTALYAIANMNDAGRTFAEIADWIEEHL